MRVPLCLLLVSCAWAAQDESRAKKQPIVVDAVGNTLPPPSNVPATVGSPVNLLTPDRYEFYTFDESGELVKRLMTLEEIQAIVAAGEEAEGLVTLANDKQPTSASNYTQPPYTILHSVVTNVKNVLKEQMEAHKSAHNKDPMFQPTLDTPDVSDSWSLILPSIFGNTGLDIVPDKTSSSDTTPETEMIEIHQSQFDEDDNLSKEGSNDILSSSTTEINDDINDGKTPATEEPKSTTTTTTTITRKPTSTTTTPKPTTIKLAETTTTEAASTTTQVPTTTTTKAPTTTTTEAPTTTTTKAPTTSTIKAPTTTKLPATTTTKTPTITSKPPTKVKLSTTTKVPPTKLSTKRVPSQSTSTSSKPRTTTSRPSVTSTSSKPRITTSTVKPTTPKIIKITPKVTTTRPSTTKKQPPTSTTLKHTELTSNVQVLNKTEEVSTEKISVQYEKVSTFIPISTVSYITEKAEPQTAKPTTSFSSTTKRSITTTADEPSTLSSTTQPTVTTYKPKSTTNTYISSTTQSEDLEKSNVTIITTQSVSPSTTVSSTEFLSIDNSNHPNAETKPTDEILVNENIEPIIPLFDLAQSISQISSDLGSDYLPIPTVSNLLDSSKLNDINLESKENFEMDIPAEPDTKKPNISDNHNDNFIKISTIDPHSDKDNKNKEEEMSIKDNVFTSQTTDKSEITTSIPETTTIDKVLSESMGDLLSQVVNQAPQSMFDSEKETEKDIKTTEAIEMTTTEISIETTSQSLETEADLDFDKHFDSNDIPNVETKVSEKSNDSNKIDFKIDNNKSTFDAILPEVTEKSIQNVTENYVKISITSNDRSPMPETLETNDFHISNKSKIEDQATLDKSDDEEKVQIINENQMAQVLLPKTEKTAEKIIEKTEETKPIDKEEVKINKNKVPEFLPKIDDFKKKIQKVNIDDKEFANERNNSWKLISTVSPPKANEVPKDKLKNGGLTSADNGHKDIVLEFSNENQGLEVTTKDLEEDIAKFTELCNELAFRYWNNMVENIDKRRSFVLSPYSITSMLAMMFMGARGATSGEMNDILKLDDMVTFNPHFTLKNISDSIETTPDSGVIVSAFIRELYSDKGKGKILTFYKERAQHFYNGHVEEINFKLISDIIRRRTNLLVKRYTWSKIAEYMKSNTITMHPPLAAFSANIFQTDCTGSSVEGRDGEMYFVVSPNVRQRRLVPVPAVVYRGGFLAGYDPVLDATAAALGNTNSIVSTLFVMPGQQGNVVHAEDLEALEQRLLDANPTTPAWNRLLRTLLPRIGLELQIPRFSHKSIFNVSSTLKKMGLKDLFDADKADLGGLNGPSKDLYLSDMVQSTTFVTCGEGVIGEQHHVEEYPEALGAVARRRASRWASDWDEPRDYQRAFHDPHDVGEAMHLPLHLRPRQARLPSRNAQPARLKFDRPFLYFVRHNPSGMILYVGRYNPRLLP